MSVLRPYWKCFQSLNDDDDMSLESYLEDWDEKFRKDVPFFSYGDDKPKEYPLTGFYPLFSDEENERLDKKIDDLIESTDLFVPNSRTCVNQVSSDKLNALLKDCEKIESNNNNTDFKELNQHFSAILENIALRKVIQLFFV